MESRTKIEKFLLPFKEEIWWMMLGLFLICNIIILTLRISLKNRKIHNDRYLYASFLVVFGSPTIYFKFISKKSRIFGGAIMILFLFLRSAYIAKLYGKYNANSGLELEYPQEAFERGYQIFAPVALAPYLRQIPEMSKEIIIKPGRQVSDSFSYFMTLKKKYLLACSERIVFFRRRINLTLWKLYKLKSTIFRQHLTLYFNLNSALPERFSGQILKLSAYGFSRDIDDKYHGTSGNDKFGETCETNAIKINNLEVEFEIWICMCFASFLVFILELLIRLSYIRNFINKIKVFGK